MTNEAHSQIFDLARTYVAGKSSLDELYEWVMDRMDEWDDSPADGDPSYLALEILDACWQHYDGKVDENVAREAIVEALNLPAPRTR